MADRTSSMIGRPSWAHRHSVEEEEWDQQQRAVFQDMDTMKKQLRERLSKPEYNVCMYYHKEGIAQKIARSSLFENVTLTVIFVNALWISVDTDHNPSEVLARAPIGFQIVEQLFCFYFVFEWVTRFIAFKRKRDGLRDAWFVFDTCLTLLFVIDTWVMYLWMKIDSGSSGQGLGDASMLRIVRLVRLTRMARMAHILKSLPELSILLKALGAAMRSVAFILVLLVALLYVFAVAFKLLCSDEEPFCNEYFPSVPHSMHTLMIHGTLMDELAVFVDAVQNYSHFILILFYIFLTLAAVTIMNMLIGILCEVVNNTAQVEREGLAVSYVQHKLQAIMVRAGMSSVFKGDHKINKEEFLQLVHDHAAAVVLLEVGVDPVGLVDFADFIFKDDLMEAEDHHDEKLLTFGDFVEVVLQLRGKNNATVRDIVDLRKFVQLRFSGLEAKLDAIAGGRKSTKVPRNRSKDRMTQAMSTSLSQDGQDMKQEMTGMTDGTGDLERQRSDSSCGVVREPPWKRTISPPSVSMNPSQDGRDTEKGGLDGTDDIGHEGTAQPLANRKDATSGRDFRNLVQRLVKEHESALAVMQQHESSLASMQRHSERLQAELDILKASNNQSPTADSKAEHVFSPHPGELQKVAEKSGSGFSPHPGEMQKVAEKGDGVPQEAGNINGSEMCETNNVKDVNGTQVDNEASGTVDWVSYMAALTPRSHSQARVL